MRRSADIGDRQNVKPRRILQNNVDPLVAADQELLSVDADTEEFYRRQNGIDRARIVLG